MGPRSPAVCVPASSTESNLATRSPVWVKSDTSATGSAGMRGHLLWGLRASSKTAGVAEVRAGEVRAGEVRVGEVRVGEVRAGEVRVAEVRAGEIRAGEVHVAEERAGEVRAAEERVGEVRAGGLRPMCGQGPRSRCGWVNGVDRG